MSIMACTECGGKVSTKAAACPHCGAPVVATPPVVVPVDQKCFECKTPYHRELKSCPACGAPNGKRTPPTTQANLPARTADSLAPQHQVAPSSPAMKTIASDERVSLSWLQIGGIVFAVLLFIAGVSLPWSLNSSLIELGGFTF